MRRLKAVGLVAVGLLAGWLLLPDAVDAQLRPLPRAARTLYWKNDAIANLADTNWVISSVYALPAGRLAVNGDRLEIEAIISLSAAASTKSYECRIGYTSFAVSTGLAAGYTLVSSNTASTSDQVLIRAAVTRQSATTISGTTLFATLVAISFKNTSYQNAQAITWANANNIACAVKDSVGAAASETINELRVTFWPR